jgi:hypothetical protein
MATIPVSSTSTKKRNHDDDDNDIYLGVDDFDDIMEKRVAFIDNTIFIKKGWRNLLTSLCFFSTSKTIWKKHPFIHVKSFFSFGAETNDFSRILLAIH